MCKETGDSDTGSVAENEGDETVEGNLEGPAWLLGTGMEEYDECLNDSSIAFARSSSSLETFPECSFDSFSERASARASSSSKSSTGAFLGSSSNLGGGTDGKWGGDETRGGGGTNTGGAGASYGESYRGDESDR